MDLSCHLLVAATKDSPLRRTKTQNETDQIAHVSHTLNFDSQAGDHKYYA